MKTKIILAVMALSLVGCVPITSHLVLDPKQGKASWYSPKDCTVESIEVWDDNGVPHMAIKNWRSSNNPQVIDSKGQSDALVAKAWGENAVNLVNAGANLMVTQGRSTALNAAVSGISTVLQKQVGTVTPAVTPSTTSTNSVP